MKEIKKRIYRFLRWSQKYTRTDMVYLTKGGFWLTLRQVISTLTSFLLVVAFANLIDPLTYGNYKYILSLVGILGIFTLIGMERAIIQAVARDLEGSFYKGFKEKLKFGTLGSLAAISLAGYYFFRGNHSLSIPLLISAIFLPLMQASRVYEGFLIGKKLFNIQTKYNVFSHIVSAGAIIITLLFTKNLFWLIAVYFISHTFLNYFFYFITKSKFKPNKKEDPKTISYGKHLSIAGIFSKISDELDKILIFHYLGAAQTAIYSFAFYPPEQLKAILKIFQGLAFPKFSEKTKQELKHVFFNKILRLAIGAGLLAILYIVIAPPIYKLLFPQYLDSIPYSQILAISLVTAGGLPVAALESKMAIKKRYAFTLFSSFSNIFLIFSLVLIYGLWGIVLGRVIARFLSFFFSLWLVKKL